ncbi:MAG: anaerobic ribonucleoside triphosphate reductase [Bacilli bacterium]|nr:anaerobic ribonucleoside triphosphate reductase [Bacilli bacterium]
MSIGLKEKMKVVKRDNKKIDFNGEKIALAIKKAFDSSDEFVELYSEEDVNKVYLAVLENIEKEYADKPFIKVEQIQDIIEKQLIKNGYQDIYEAFSKYREKRAESRKMFLSEPKQHKLMKAIEKLSLKDASENDSKRENANIDGNGAMGIMLQYGSAISKEFAKSYLMSYKFAEAHDNGQIHIHDMDFFAMGTTTCTQIDLDHLFEKGFSTGHGHLRSPNSIMTYAALTAIAIQANQNDQHGGQSIPAFDYYLAPGVLKTFKKQLKQTLYDFLDISGFLTFIDFDVLAKDIMKLTSIEFDLTIFDKYIKEESQVRRLFEKAYEKAIAKTDRETYQAMEAFIHNLNTMHSRAGAQVPFSSVNFGTDTSPEGRMVIKNYLLATDSGLGKKETPIFPISIFKVKEGINYNPGDPNYDLFKLSCRVSAKRLFPNFSFMDAPFNAHYYKEGNFDTEVSYMGCRTRVIGNVVHPDKETTSSRGNLSFTSINLPRIGIKYGIVNNKKADFDGFFIELGNIMDLVRDQLLERFEIQCSKRLCNFPFLLGQGLYMDSKNLKPNDRLKKVLKHGTLSIGFIGLAECLKALTGQHHGESKKAQELGLKIIGFMRERCDKYSADLKLNFTLLATPAEGLSGRFVNIDKSIYGAIEDITDREYYTNSFHIPVYHSVSIADKIKLEAPYHALTNAGHITYVELDGDTTNNIDAFEKVVRIMKEAGIGYGAINHPVDRDPVCGYTGVIGDLCPNCERTEDNGPHFERIRRVTGYLVGTVERFNNAKQAEEKDRIKHDTKEILS